MLPFNSENNCDTNNNTNNNSSNNNNYDNINQISLVSPNQNQGTIQINQISPPLQTYSLSNKNIIFRTVKKELLSTQTNLPHKFTVKRYIIKESKTSDLNSNGHTNRSLESTTNGNANFVMLNGSNDKTKSNVILNDISNRKTILPIVTQLSSNQSQPQYIQTIPITNNGQNSEIRYLNQSSSISLNINNKNEKAYVISSTPKIIDGKFYKATAFTLSDKIQTTNILQKQPLLNCNKNPNNFDKKIYTTNVQNKNTFTSLLARSSSEEDKEIMLSEEMKRLLEEHDDELANLETFADYMPAKCKFFFIFVFF